MHRFVLLVLSIIATVYSGLTMGKNMVKEPATMPSAQPDAVGVLNFSVKDIDGNEKNLADYRGKVVMIVNVASKCGNTKQYAALEKIYQNYKDRGLVILGFPANQFGGQEPGSEAQIKEFCTSKYQVTFPMMSKVIVKGEGKHPLYKYLTEPSTAGELAGEIEWNFQKFLVDRSGRVFARFAPKLPPDDPSVLAAIEKALR